MKRDQRTAPVAASSAMSAPPLPPPLRYTTPSAWDRLRRRQGVRGQLRRADSRANGGAGAAPPLGVATIAAAGIGFVLVLALLWLDDPREGLIRTWGVVTIAALGCSHAAIVLRGARSTDARAISAIVAVSIGLAAIDGTDGALATAGAVEVDEDDPGARWMAVTVVLL